MNVHMKDTDLKLSEKALMRLKHYPLADVFKFFVVIGLIIWLMVGMEKSSFCFRYMKYQDKK